MKVFCENSFFPKNFHVFDRVLNKTLLRIAISAYYTEDFEIIHLVLMQNLPEN